MSKSDNTSSAQCNNEVRTIKILEGKVKRLKKLLTKELSENDEFGMEYTGIGLLKDENMKLKEQIKDFLCALNIISGNEWPTEEDLVQSLTYCNREELIGILWIDMKTAMQALEKWK